MAVTARSAFVASLAVALLSVGCPKEDNPVLDLQKDPKFRHQSGVSALRSGNADRAVRELEAARALAPKDVEVLHALGLAYTQSGRGNKAVEVLSEALALRPKDGALLNSRGVALVRQRRFDEAVKDFEAAQAPDARYDTPQYAMLNLAGAYSEMQRYDQALATLEKALTFSPRDPAIQTALCRTLDLAKRNDEARRACQQAIQDDPTFASGYFELGKVELKARHNGAALAAFENYLKLDPRGENAEQARRYQSLLKPGAPAPSAEPLPSPTPQP